MNPLEPLISILKIKPVVSEHSQVNVLIKGEFLDERENEFDIETLMKKLADAKLTTVIIKPTSVREEEVLQPPVEPEPALTTKKVIGKKGKLVIEEDEGEEQGPGVKVVLPKKTERKTKPVEKGIAILGPETFVQIGDTPINQRLPVRERPFKIIASSYYMNNREKFVNFINSLFAPYKEELKRNAENISCDTIGNSSGNISLLIHQEIVRDYMNLYTPYRGLLLYHGLGSGKTCSSIAIAEGMKGPKKIIIMTPKSLRRNYMEELKKCGDLMYKKDQFWEFIPAQSNSELARILSSILNLPMEYIKKKKGAWFVNITKPSNYAELTPNQAISLDDQLDEMIQSKYMFINYNGLRAKRLEELTSGFTKNLFDNSVVIIDEAHNLVSRIVNKIKKEPLVNEIKRGDQERISRDLAKRLSDMLEKIPTISELSEKKISELPKELKEVLTNVRGNLEINDEERNILETNINIFLKAIKKINEPASIQQITDIQGPVGIIITRLQTNPVLESRVGEKEFLPKHLSSKLYEYLLSAKDAKIVLLTGTPVINYPNEFGILFNILRGYIKTWEFPISDTTTRAFNRDDLFEMLKGEKSLDYIDYDQNLKYLTITRNPFGFKNKIKKEEGYKGVTNAKEVSRGVLDVDTSSFDSDTEFEKRIIGILKRNNIDVLVSGIKINNKKALPDTLDLFEGQYIDNVTKQIKNLPALNRRILGLSSYFRSAQESLLPRFTRTIGRDYHIVKIPMSNFQFKIYEAARVKERKTEKPKKGAESVGGLYKEATSTYKIFSRLYCNYVMPDRPTPGASRDLKIAAKFEENFEENLQDTLANLQRINEKYEAEGRPASDMWNLKEFEYLWRSRYGKETDEQLKEEANRKIAKFREKIGRDLQPQFDKLLEAAETEERKTEITQKKADLVEAILVELQKKSDAKDVDDDNEGEIEGDELLEEIGGLDYKQMIDRTLKNIEEHSNDFLTPEALEKYSPKFLHMLENISDPRNVGLHLVYSQFRTLEGVGIFSLVLEKNGFARFKLTKTSANSWDIDISEADAGKPTYALYTGTETHEEREIIRNIYNGDWKFVPTNIAEQLRAKSNNNNTGDIIKVLMITSSGSEGINLRNTRFVHIMEPYWHPVRLEQVIGRARRICSHKNLPQALQTVEVFVYLMVFTAEQLESDDAIELKRKDLSKIDKVPVTSDQLLYEISEIKGNLTRQLTDSIKESSFDCQLYSNGKCVNFGEPDSSKFSYFPDYTKEADDNSYKLNQTQKITWKGKPITIGGVDYVYKRINDNLLNIYDKDSYNAAIKNPSVEPLLIGTLETIEGKRVFKPV
jgi:hypothetical protein